MMLPILAALFAVTAGWENVQPGRAEPRLPADRQLWRADFCRPEDFRLVRRDGAEGLLSFRDGELTIRKTNGIGELIVEAPTFPLGSNVVIRFLADVHVAKALTYRSHGCLRATAGDGTFGVAPEVRESDTGNARNIVGGLIEQAPGMYYRKWCHYLGTGGVVHPLIIVSGAPSVSTWRDWSAEDRQEADAAYRKLAAQTGLRRPKPEDALVSAEAVVRQCAESPDHTAKVVTENGVAYLTVDGGKIPPTAFHSVYHHADYGEMTAGQPVTKAGVPLTVAWVNGTWTCDPKDRNWTSDRPFDAAKAANDLREMMRGDTNALYLVAYSCNAPSEFVRRDHPDEAWITEPGLVMTNRGPLPVDKAAAGGEEVFPWPSMASPAWQAAVQSNLCAFAAELRRTGLSRRVVGIHLMGFCDGQFNMYKPDCSPCARQAYAQYVAANAGSGLSTNYWHFCRQLGVLAQHAFAKTFKRAMGKDVVAIRWDSAPFVVDYANGTMMRDAGGLDICVTQPTYADRGPAQVDAPYVPWSSLTRHNKMHWYEMDLRTWWSRVDSGPCDGPSVGYSPDAAHWCATYRKLAGEMLATRSGFWFYDMGCGWFAAPEIAADIADSVKTMRRLTEKKPSPWHNDVAVVADEEGQFGVEGGPDFPWSSTLYCVCERQLAYLSAAGVPYDFYLADDVIGNPEIVAKKKVVVFLFWRQFDARRMAAVRALFNRGQTHVFLWESGCLGGAKEATGFDIDYVPNQALSFVLKPEDGFTEDTTCTWETEMRRGWLVKTGSRRPFYEPSDRYVAIREAPGVRVHARYAADPSKVAIAERHDPEARRWYLAAPGGLTPEIFGRIVREARAYAPVDRSGLIVSMNGDFVSVHALQGGSYDFRLPFPATVTNVKSGQAEPTKDGVLPLDLTAGETCWFLLEANERKGQNR